MENKIFDTLLEPVCIIDQDTRVTYCNDAFALLLQSRSVRIMRNKTPLRELILSKSPLHTLDNLQGLKDSTPYQEIEFAKPDGSAGRAQVNVQPWSEGLWLVFFRDVTLEETLQRKYRGELEKKESVIRDLEVAHEKLAAYSQNLEAMVATRAKEIVGLNQKMTAMLDSLDQGFLIFGPDGLCLEVASRACVATLGCDPRRLHIWDVLNLEGAKAEGFRKWLKIAFSELLPFADLTPLAPQTFLNNNRHINLSYHAIREDEKIKAICLVASDVSDLLVARDKAERERHLAQMILQLVRHKRQAQNFIREAEHLILRADHEVNLEQPDLIEAFRMLHTLKGGAASFAIHPLVKATHAAEDGLKRFEDSRDSASHQELRDCVRELRFKLQEFINESVDFLGAPNSNGEMMRELSTAALADFYAGLPQGSIREKFFETFLLEPFGPMFSHFDEALQAAARMSGKEVGPLEIDANVAIWPMPYEPIIGALVHAVRNAVDHGIEHPAERAAIGKSPTGRVGIRTKRVFDTIRLQIWDDGRGVDVNRVRAKLTALGVSCQGEIDDQIIQHIFDTDFSTAAKVTELSGRGIGLSALREAVRLLDGTIRIRSTPGKGSIIHIDLPWIETLDFKKPAAA